MKTHLNTVRGLPLALTLVAGLAITSRVSAAEPYATQLDALRSEITAKLPKIDDAARKAIVEAKDPKARVEAVRKLTALDPVLASNALDAKLAKFFVINEATPTALESFAGQGAVQKKLLESLLADDALLLQIAIADGACPLHAKGKPATPPNYGKAMEIYSAIQQASPKAKQGVLQRLALAVALEFSEVADPSGDDDEPAGGKSIDPVKRYLHFEKAREAGELDANFDRLTVWELRFVVCAPESDEVLTWGREMLRNFRPDHIYTDNQGWRYANVVNTDVRYGSIDVRNDRPELHGMQNILMNGGICGRRAFFARYICRAFGIPATARPSGGHGASARWTPQGWAVVLGPGWGQGWTTTRYRNDHDFVATTQARTRGDEFLKVKRAQWIGDVMGEPRTHGERDNKTAPAFWNGVALATQGRIIEDTKAVALDALGAEFGEANGPTVAGKIATSSVTPEDRMITFGENGSIIIPAAALAKKEDKKEDKEEDSSEWR
jgi:hypothetical protein